MSVQQLPPAIRAALRCPTCGHPFRWSDGERGESYDCTNAACATRFPVVNGVPVFINERGSVFTIADFARGRSTFFNLERGRYRLSPGGIATRLKEGLKARVPEIGANLKGRENYARFAGLLRERSARPAVLVLGGSIVGVGMDALTADGAVELVETDVSFGPRTRIVCDAHDIPFAAETFDGVVVQAVLEHVVDPARCVEEVRRVLKADGLVYAETPFMQQVHGRQYDFTRFTHLGHRRLFRHFEEVASGAVSGPGSALAWSYQYGDC